MAERWKSSRGLFKCGGNSKHANLLSNAPRGHVPSPPKLALHSSAPGEVLWTNPNSGLVVHRQPM